jgi:hypothetical protein
LDGYWVKRQQHHKILVFLLPPLSLFSLVVMNSLREREEREKIICVRTVQSVEPEHGRKEGGFSQKKLVAVRKLDI